MTENGLFAYFLFNYFILARNSLYMLFLKLPLSLVIFVDGCMESDNAPSSQITTLTKKPGRKKGRNLRNVLFPI